MSLSRISAALRREVRERARECCEYCLVAESEIVFPHDPDHLIARKHGGSTVSENLALACYDCNRFKGADIASIDVLTGALTRLFNPRTETILRLNLPVRVQIRERLAAGGKYPLRPTNN